MATWLSIGIIRSGRTKRFSLERGSKLLAIEKLHDQGVALVIGLGKSMTLTM